MLYAGVIAAELWNANPYRGKGATRVSALDFVPKSRRLKDETEQTLDEQIRLLTAVMKCGPGQEN